MEREIILRFRTFIRLILFFFPIGILLSLLLMLVQDSENTKLIHMFNYSGFFWVMIIAMLLYDFIIHRVLKAGAFIQIIKSKRTDEPYYQIDIEYFPLIDTFSAIPIPYLILLLFLNSIDNFVLTSLLPLMAILVVVVLYVEIKLVEKLYRVELHLAEKNSIIMSSLSVLVAGSGFVGGIFGSFGVLEINTTGIISLILGTVCALLFIPAVGVWAFILHKKLKKVRDAIEKKGNI